MGECPPSRWKNRKKHAQKWRIFPQFSAFFQWCPPPSEKCPLHSKILTTKDRETSNFWRLYFSLYSVFPKVKFSNACLVPIATFFKHGFQISKHVRACRHVKLGPAALLSRPRITPPASEPFMEPQIGPSPHQVAWPATGHPYNILDPWSSGTYRGHRGGATRRPSPATGFSWWRCVWFTSWPILLFIKKLNACQVCVSVSSRQHIKCNMVRHRVTENEQTFKWQHFVFVILRYMVISCKTYLLSAPSV